MYSNIKAEMARANITQAYLAKLLGRSPHTVHCYLYGKTPIPAGVLVKMSEIFGKSTDYLLGISSE